MERAKEKLRNDPQIGVGEFGGCLCVASDHIQLHKVQASLGLQVLDFVCLCVVLFSSDIM